MLMCAAPRRARTSLSLPVFGCGLMMLPDAPKCQRALPALSEMPRQRFCPGSNITENLRRQHMFTEMFSTFGLLDFPSQPFFSFFFGDFFFLRPSHAVGRRSAVCNRARYLHSGLFSTSFILSLRSRWRLRRRSLTPRGF